jgi:hypothetical protein
MKDKFMLPHKPEYYLDANCINARQKDPALNELEALHEEGKILLIPRPAYDEARVRSEVRQEKTENYCFVGIVDYERFKTRLTIEHILFPNGAKTDNPKKDIEILEVARQTRTTLITMDGASRSQPSGMLGHRDELAKFGIKILRPAEALAEIKTLLGNNGGD